MASYFRKVRLLCEACHTDIINSQYTRCSAERCNAPFYHNQCLGATSSERSGNWVCNKCRRENKRGEGSINVFRPHMGEQGIKHGHYGGQFMSEHVSQHIVQQMTQQNNQQLMLAVGGEHVMQHSLHRSKGRSKRSAHYNSEAAEAAAKASDQRIASLSEEILKVRQEIAALNEQFTNLSSSSNLHHSRLDDVFSQLNTSDERIRNLEYWEIEIVSLKSQIAVLQDNLQNQVELIGVPENRGENLLQIVLVAAALFGVEFEEYEIDWVTRVGAKKYDDEGKLINRPVVMKFVRKIKRNEFLKAGKAKRDLTSNDLQIDNTMTRIFVNERLTREVRYLFHEARRRAKLANYEFCWTQNGNVFIRKREGYPAIRLVNRLDLNEKLGCMNSQIQLPNTADDNQMNQ